MSGSGYQKFKRRSDRILVRIRQRVPPGGRLVIGLLLIVGGIFGFLPILGFWMLPLGIAIAAMDIKPLYRKLVCLTKKNGKD